MVLMLKKAREKNKYNLDSQIYIRPLHHKDKNQVCRFMNQAFIIHHTFVVPGPNAVPYDFATNAYAKRYFHQLISDEKRLSFAIMKGKDHIGNIGLKEIDKKKGNAECFIEIGESRFRGKGFGYDAMRLLLNYTFIDLALVNLELDVLEFNAHAIRLYKRLGFMTIGPSFWHYDEFGIYWRVLNMSISASDFFKRHGLASVDNSPGI